MFGTIFCALLSAALGVSLAAVHLATLPVEVKRSAPKEAPASGSRYIVLGASGAAGSGWQAKREIAESGAAGRVVTFKEAELNSWSEATFPPPKPAAGAKAEPFFIVAGTPNFRVDGAKLQIGMVNTLHFFGSQSPLVLQARGAFGREAESWVYQPEEVMLGALPLHKVPGLVSVVAARFGANKTPADAAGLLGRAKTIVLRDGALVAEMP